MYVWFERYREMYNRDICLWVEENTAKMHLMYHCGEDNEKDGWEGGRMMLFSS